MAALFGGSKVVHRHLAQFRCLRNQRPAFLHSSRPWDLAGVGGSERAAQQSQGYRLPLQLPAGEPDETLIALCLLGHRFQGHVVSGQVLLLPAQPPLLLQRPDGPGELAPVVAQHLGVEQLAQPRVKRAGDSVQEGQYCQQVLRGQAVRPAGQPFVQVLPGADQVRGQAGHAGGPHPPAALFLLSQQQAGGQGKKGAAVALLHVARVGLLRGAVQIQVQRLDHGAGHLGGLFRVKGAQADRVALDARPPAELARHPLSDSALVLVAVGGQHPQRVLASGQAQDGIGKEAGLVLDIVPQQLVGAVQAAQGGGQAAQIVAPEMAGHDDHRPIGAGQGQLDQGVALAAAGPPGNQHPLL